MRASALALLLAGCAPAPPAPRIAPTSSSPSDVPAPVAAAGSAARSGDGGSATESSDAVAPESPASEPSAAEPAAAESPVTEPSAAESPVTEPAPVSTATRITVPVPGDNPLEVVLGPPDAGRAIVYLHGVCGDPLAFESWTEAAASRATFISLRGDERCGDRPGRFKWSFDYARLDRRIQRALEVVDAIRHREATPVTPLDRDDVVLVGYSQGAHRVQWMAARFPARYRRVALIALSTEPSPARLAQAERILVVAGGWDARAHLWEGHNALKKAGKTVLYTELPKARHGEYGPAAQETMNTALEWLFK